MDVCYGQDVIYDLESLLNETEKHVQIPSPDITKDFNITFKKGIMELDFLSRKLSEMYCILTTRDNEYKKLCIQYSSLRKRYSELETAQELLQLKCVGYENTLTTRTNHKEAYESHINQLQSLVKKKEADVEYCEEILREQKITINEMKKHVKYKEKRIKNTNMKMSAMKDDITYLIKQCPQSKRNLKKFNSLQQKYSLKLKNFKEINYSLEENSDGEIEMFETPIDSPLSPEVLVQNQSAKNQHSQKFTQAFKEDSIISAKRNNIDKLFGSDSERDSDNSNEVVSEDTGRGSSLAFSDTKSTHSSQYYINDSPPNNNMCKNVEKCLIDRATSPIIPMKQNSRDVGTDTTFRDLSELTQTHKQDRSCSPIEDLALFSHADKSSLFTQETNTLTDTSQLVVGSIDKQGSRDVGTNTTFKDLPELMQTHKQDRSCSPNKDLALYNHADKSSPFTQETNTLTDTSRLVVGCIVKQDSRDVGTNTTFKDLSELTQTHKQDRSCSPIEDLALFSHAVKSSLFTQETNTLTDTSRLVVGCIDKQDSRDVGTNTTFKDLSELTQTHKQERSCSPIEDLALFSHADKSSLFTQETNTLTDTSRLVVGCIDKQDSRDVGTNTTFKDLSELTQTHKQDRSCSPIEDLALFSHADKSSLFTQSADTSRLVINLSDKPVSNNTSIEQVFGSNNLCHDDNLDWEIQDILKEMSFTRELITPMTTTPENFPLTVERRPSLTNLQFEQIPMVEMQQVLPERNDESLRNSPQARETLQIQNSITEENRDIQEASNSNTIELPHIVSNNYDLGVRNRKLSKLQRFMNRCIPKSKIRPVTVPVKKVTPGFKPINSELKNKDIDPVASKEKAIKIMAEISKQKESSIKDFRIGIPAKDIINSDNNKTNEPRRVLKRGFCETIEEEIPCKKTLRNRPSEPYNANNLHMNNALSEKLQESHTTTPSTKRLYSSIKQLNDDDECLSNEVRNGGKSLENVDTQNKPAKRVLRSSTSKSINNDEKLTVEAQNKERLELTLNTEKPRKRILRSSTSRSDSADEIVEYKKCDRLSKSKTPDRKVHKKKQSVVQQNNSVLDTHDIRCENIISYTDIDIFSDKPDTVQIDKCNTTTNIQNSKRSRFKDSSLTTNRNQKNLPMTININKNQHELQTNIVIENNNTEMSKDNGECLSNEVRNGGKPLADVDSQIKPAKRVLRSSTSKSINNDDKLTTEAHNNESLEPTLNTEKTCKRLLRSSTSRSDSADQIVENKKCDRLSKSKTPDRKVNKRKQSAVPQKNSVLDKQTNSLDTHEIRRENVISYNDIFSDKPHTVQTDKCNTTNIQNSKDDTSYSVVKSTRTQFKNNDISTNRNQKDLPINSDKNKNDLEFRSNIVIESNNMKKLTRSQGILLTDAGDDKHNNIISYSDIDMFTDDVTPVQCGDVNLESVRQTKEGILCRMIERHGKVPTRQITTLKQKKRRGVSDINAKKICAIFEERIADIIKLTVVPYHDNIKPEMNRLVVDMSKWYYKDVTMGVVKYLMEPQRKVELFNKIYTPPAPAMTKGEQILLYVLLELRTSWPSVDLIKCVMLSLEYSLFQLNRTPDFDAVESMSHFYAILCKYCGQLRRLRIFMLDAMYCIQYKSVTVIKQCLDVNMHVLPLAHQGLAKNTLVTGLVYLLHFYKCEDRLNKVQDIRFILNKKYFYKTSEWNQMTTLENLKRSIMELRDNELQKKMLGRILILLGKRHGWQWCHNHVITNILQPIIENPKVGDNVRQFCVSMIGPLLKPFPTNEMNVHIVCMLNRLTDMLHQEQSPKLQEAIITTLIYMSRHNANCVNQVLYTWKPHFDVSAELEYHLRRYVREKPMKIWKIVLCKSSNVNQFNVN